MGDFNCPDIDWNSLSSTGSGFPSSLLNFSLEHSLTQHVNCQTRFRSTSSSCLDLIFTNEADIIDKVTTLPPLGKSDHVLLSWDFLLSWTRILEPLPNFRKFKKANFDKL